VVPNHAVETLWVLSIGAAIVFGFDLLMRTLRGYFIDVAGKKVDVILSASIFERMMGVRMEVRPASVGVFANNLQEFEAFRDFLTSATITTLIDLPFIVLFILVIWWVGGPLALIPLNAVPVVIVVGLILQGSLRKVVQEVFRHSAQRQATLIETLSGLETVKSVGAEGPIQRKWEQVIGQIARLGLRARFLSAAVVNVSVFIQQIVTIAVVIYGVYLISEKELTTGALIACTILTGRILAPLSQVAGLLTRYYQSKAALDSLNNMMRLPVERPPGKSFVHRPKFHGDVEFKNVNFSYPGQTLPALSAVSFKIAAGERVGIIGRIGSGKTTIEKLILGLYNPTSGSVLIDGIDLQQIDPAELRHNIGYVPQDVVLFYGSVKDNITMGAPYVDDSAMLRAAEIAGVADFVNRHPMGFDMPVGERGDGLSGGQKQTIAIARAQLLDPPVLLMDEPSNSIDNRSEELFKSRLANNLENKTLILVTHRASLLTLVNRLIVIDGGRVVADGAKEQVLAALAEGRLNVAK
jgi:ATP-binding cassette subfamily C protein LapB